MRYPFVRSAVILGLLSFATFACEKMPTAPSSGETSSAVANTATGANLEFGPNSPQKVKLGLQCATGRLTPAGSNAGFADFKRRQLDWYGSSPDYRIYGNHRGGYGDTLEYVGCRNSEAVWLQWAYNGLVTVAVRAPWNGFTDRGLTVGDTKEKLQSLYPSAHPQTSVRAPLWPSDYEVWDDGPLRVAFRNGKIYIIQAEWMTTKGSDAAESTSIQLGPCGCKGPGGWN
jgi:hypothetical protein